MIRQMTTTGLRRLALVPPMLLATTLGACGIDFTVSGLEDEVAQAAAEYGPELVELALESDELAQLAEGVDGVTVNVGDVAVQIQTQNNGDSTAMAPLSGLSIAAATDDCADGLPGDNICFISDTKTNFPSDSPVAEETFWGLLYFPDGTTDGKVVLIDAQGSKKYKSGATESIEITDLEYDNGTTDADLGRHKIRIDVVKVHPDGGRLDTEHGIIVANFNGIADDDPRRSDVADDTADTFYHASFEQVFADGRTQRLQAWPADPVTRGTEPSGGTVTREVTFPSGPLTAALETFTWSGRDTNAPTASGLERKEFSDGTTEFATVEIANQTVTVHREGRKGVIADTEIDLVAKTLDRVITFPSGHALDEITLSGSLTHDGPGKVHLEFVRTMNFADGTTQTIDASVDRDRPAGRTDVTYTKTLRDGGQETGDVTVVRSLLSRDIVADVTRPNGNEVHLEATSYADGSATVYLTVDKPETVEDPDFEAEFTRNADGTGEGTLTNNVSGAEYTFVHNADGSTDVTQTKDGTDAVEVGGEG